MKMKIREADVYVSLWVIVFPFIIIVLPLLFGCYSQKKATSQFSKAVVAYPKIASDYCATSFPVKDSIVKDTVNTTDTLFMAGELTTDTVTINDTVRITTIKTLPGKVITNTIHVTDTVYRENAAKLRSCELDKSSLTASLNKEIDRADKYEAKAKKRGLILWGLLLLIALVIGYNIYRRLKPLAK